ncbi:hypothetical protein CDD81_3358 [Ophiocordyceps australis]|uniref:Superoxide dismutase 1 copper chaperone n=1 Tax=Ophiocordyceps australis TaxID=1399860 RepID=A0A2C5XXB9_9HYPO|nr:hypothetical protein CDD81_3358 [Ophiocordyceps australis]
MYSQISRGRIDTMAFDDSFHTLFAVPLSCDGCVKEVSEQLYRLGGISKVEANLEDQLISVEGKAAPSAIVEAIQATGRDAILRGSGAADSAAVSILETCMDKGQALHEPGDRQVRGLARMVQTSPDMTLVDLTIRGVTPGTYRASIRAYGDFKDGVKSTGPIWSEGEVANGNLGVLEVADDGRGAAFTHHRFQVHQVIGHALVVTKQDEALHALDNNQDTMGGVIARSAGAWDNDKTPWDLEAHSMAKTNIRRIAWQSDVNFVPWVTC